MTESNNVQAGNAGQPVLACNADWTGGGEVQDLSDEEMFNAGYPVGEAPYPDPYDHEDQKGSDHDGYGAPSETPVSPQQMGTVQQGTIPTLDPAACFDGGPLTEEKLQSIAYAVQNTPPLSSEVALWEVLNRAALGGRSLTEFFNQPIDPALTLLGNRLLCTGGAMLFIGPSGIGKSSASVQMDILWSLGQPALGITPARPLKIVCIQCENDDGDMTEMARGIMGGLRLTEDDRQGVHAGTVYIRHKNSTGITFLAFVERVLERYRPDILRLDPLQGFLGGDPKDAGLISTFIVGLNPLLDQYHCAAIINHHTPKSQFQNTGAWREHDWMYAGAGAAALTNWARAVLVIDPHPEDRQVFKFIAAKRWSRFGWQAPDGTYERSRWFRHSRHQGEIFWEPLGASEVPSDKATRKTKDDLMRHVPVVGSIEKNALISKAGNEGIGQAKARGFIAELVNDKRIVERHSKRSGKRDEIQVERPPRPIDGAVVNGCE